MEGFRLTVQRAFERTPTNQNVRHGSVGPPKKTVRALAVKPSALIPVPVSAWGRGDQRRPAGLTHIADAVIDFLAQIREIFFESFERRIYSVTPLIQCLFWHEITHHVPHCQPEARTAKPMQCRYPGRPAGK